MTSYTHSYMGKLSYLSIEAVTSEIIRGVLGRAERSRHPPLARPPLCTHIVDSVTIVRDRATIDGTILAFGPPYNSGDNYIRI